MVTVKGKPQITKDEYAYHKWINDYVGFSSCVVRLKSTWFLNGGIRWSVVLQYESFYNKRNWLVFVSCKYHLEVCALSAIPCEKYFTKLWPENNVLRNKYRFDILQVISIAKYFDLYGSVFCWNDDKLCPSPSYRSHHIVNNIHSAKVVILF